MAVILNHTIVRAADQDAAALFFAELLGLPVGERTGPFTPVRVNDDLTFDFDQRHAVVPGHFGFLVDDRTFDLLIGRLETRNSGVPRQVHSNVASAFMIGSVLVGSPPEHPDPAGPKPPLSGETSTPPSHGPTAPTHAPANGGWAQSPRSHSKR